MASLRCWCWNSWKENWNKAIELEGFEKTKKEWIDCRDGELNQEITKELNASEAAKWNQIVRWTNKRFGIANKNDNWKNEEELSKQPLDYKALIIGGLTGLAIGLILGLMVNKRK